MLTLINVLSFYKLTQVRTLLNGESTKRSKVNQMLVSDEIEKKKQGTEGKISRDTRSRGATTH